MKTNMSEEDLRRWAIQEILVRRGYGNTPLDQRIEEADKIVNYIRTGALK